MSYNDEEYVQILQKLYTANVDRINNDTSIKNIDYIKVALLEAEQIWLNTQVLIRSKRYSTMTDDEKTRLFQKDFGEFYKNFPIVSKYMICMKQYKRKAFKKMLLKCEEDGKKEYTVETKPSNEDQYIIRQADYIRFLWEEYQGTYDPKESDKVWVQARDLLKKEFDDFKRLHEEMERKVKEDQKKHKKELLYEMSDRIINGSQALKQEDGAKMLNDLKSLLYKQRSKKVINELKQRPPIDCLIVEGLGANEYEKAQYDDEMQQSMYKKKYKKMDISKIIA